MMTTITEKEFRQLADLIKKNYGIHLKQEKKSLVIGRLQKVLDENGLQSFSQYIEYLNGDTTGNALITLVDRITTNHTFFMREADHFDFLKDEILPFLISTVKNNDLRIWSAGCSTGEEPYTLAMLLDDSLGTQKGMWNRDVLATDISSKVLEIAKKGIYENSHIATLPEKWKKKYFHRVDEERSVVNSNIISGVIYRRFNLMEPVFPFKKRFHVIFCRNVMIYFDSKTKKELVEKFYEYTEPGGYLFIGHSESLNGLDTKYKYIMPAIYRKE